MRQQIYILQSSLEHTFIFRKKNTQKWGKQKNQNQFQITTIGTHNLLFIFELILFNIFFFGCFFFWQDLYKISFSISLCAMHQFWCFDIIFKFIFTHNSMENLLTKKQNKKIELAETDMCVSVYNCYSMLLNSRITFMSKISYRKTDIKLLFNTNAMEMNRLMNF